MSKTATIRLNDNTYKLFRTLAENNNRPLSKFIETSALRYIEEHQLIDDFEMAEIKSNQDLIKSLKRGVKDAKSGRESFIG